jgi:hypothetical protein
VGDGEQDMVNRADRLLGEKKKLLGERERDDMEVVLLVNAPLHIQLTANPESVVQLTMILDYFHQNYEISPERFNEVACVLLTRLLGMDGYIKPVSDVDEWIQLGREVKEMLMKPSA